MTRISSALALCALLAACNPQTLFVKKPPDIDSARLYADQVCEGAGSQSQSCANAKLQINSRCYRTLGTVDCYTSENPFGTNDDSRAFVLPIDKRKPTPSPG